jgi:hypothetical protein
MRPEEQIEFKELVLHPLASAVRYRLAQDALHSPIDMEHMFDHATRSMVLQLRTHVLADRLPDEEVCVPFSKTETVTITPPDVLLPLVALTGGATAWGLLIGCLPLLIAAMLLALVAVAAHARLQSATQDVTVAGDVVVKAGYYRAFPEAAPHYYPPDLGRGRPVVVPIMQRVDYRDVR